MLKISNLFVAHTKDYNSLHDLNLILGKNKTAIICGSLDSGKTTLIRTIIGNEKPAKGEILINNININDVDFSKDVSLAYLPINQIFFENKSVKYNLQYVLKIRKLNQLSIDAMINDTLYEYDIPMLKEVKIKELSYFEKIKIAIARLSQRNIDIMLVDDIFSKLTNNETKEIIELLEKLIKKNQAAALIFISDPELKKQIKCDDFYELNYGTLNNIKEGTNEN